MTQAAERKRPQETNREMDRETHVATPVREGDGVRGAMLSGLAVVALLAGGVGAWGAAASLSGAVLAPGAVVVDSNVKKVQHPSGGTVGQIFVREGDRVALGALLIRLDETVARANLQIVAKQLDELAVQQARLKAERDGAAAVETPPALAARRALPEVAALLAGERSLFESRRSAREGQKAQFRERINQLHEEIEGLGGQRAAKTREVELVKKELAGAETLWKQNLMPITRLTSLQREAARLEGEQAQLRAQTAQARGRISEIELQIIQLDQELRASANKELREIQAKEAELVERRVTAEHQIRHIDIRAPQAGAVHQLAVHTIGGVIAQGETIMLIVPENDALVIEAKVAPQDIDQVRPGQPALLRFTAFDQRSTPEFEGRVTRVSADLTREQQTGAAYYIARLALDRAAGPKGNPPAGGLTLIPGMPVEAHIRTGERTALSYFVKPLRDQFARAFTER
jgi:HlyD family secretion protein